MDPRTRRATTAIALAIAATSAGLLALDVASPLRVAPAIAFVLFVPGWSVVGLLRLRDPIAELALTTTLSLTLGIAVAQLLVWQDAYTVGWTFALLAALSAPGLLVQLARRDEQPVPATIDLTATPVRRR